MARKLMPWFVQCANHKLKTDLLVLRQHSVNEEDSKDLKGF